MLILIQDDILSFKVMQLSIHGSSLSQHNIYARELLFIQEQDKVFEIQSCYSISLLWSDMMYLLLFQMTYLNALSYVYINHMRIVMVQIFPHGAECHNVSVKRRLPDLLAKQCMFHAVLRVFLEKDLCHRLQFPELASELSGMKSPKFCTYA